MQIRYKQINLWTVGRVDVYSAALVHDYRCIGSGVTPFEAARHQSEVTPAWFSHNKINKPEVSDSFQSDRKTI